MSSFFGINIALSGLRAQQYAMDVTGHNIANANTPGYRRQEVVSVAGSPASGTIGILGSGVPQLGTGVMVHSIRQAQTDFLDSQIRLSCQSSGSWSAKNTALGQLETILGEPGENGLSAILSKFWNSWEDLSASPESAAARTAVAESGEILADRIRNLHYNLRTAQTNADIKVTNIVKDINIMAQEIARINEQITQPVSNVYQPNDLLNRRDMLLEQMSQMVDIQVHGMGGADLIVSIGGKVLVQGNQYCAMGVSYSPEGRANPVWESDGSQVLVSAGELRGYLDVRDRMLENYVNRLNDITAAIVSRVNEIHSNGATMTGEPAGNFFIPGSTSYDIAVLPELMRDPARIAAGALGNGINDNSVANAVAGIRRETFMGGQTIGSSYATLISQIASNAGEARTQAHAHEVSLNQRKVQREAVAGVSLDEEMVNMMKFQHGYNAAARILTVMDEMLESIINRLGTGGR